jgi:hypothetical protein
MIVRLIKGLFLGMLLGAAVALLATKGLHLTFGEDSALFSYLFAVVTGVLAGLVAGKPIWSQTGKIEAGLKAFFGAVLAAGALFALRKWVTVSLDLTAYGFGKGALGDLPVLALPMVGGALAGFFELDNNDEPEKAEGQAAAKGKSAEKQRVNVTEEEESEEEVSSKKQRR